MKEDSPKISIIMPCHNRANLISESILSVQNQTYTNWELLIIDDYSNDETEKKINLEDKRIKFYKKKDEGKGACVSRNIGIDNAAGDFIIFLDSDDLLARNCLENRLNVFKKYPHFDFLVFQTSIFKQHTHDTNILINTETIEDIFYRFFNLDIPWLTTGPIWKKNSILRLGKWDDTLPSWQDWEYHLRALLFNFKFKYIHTVDNFWRLDEKNQSIGAESGNIHHLSSQLSLINKLKLNFNKNDFKTKKLLGLEIWILEQILNKKYSFKLLIKYFTSLRHFNSIKGPCGFIFFLLTTKSLFDLQKPNFGVFRKVIAPPNNRLD